jgi:para-aminobenzoate synthetase component I
MEEFINLMNKYGSEREPFLFIVDFDMIKPEIHRLASVPASIKFSTPLIPEASSRQIYSKPVVLKRKPLPFGIYSQAFDNVKRNIQMGNSYLLNLTFPTIVECDLTLKEIYEASVAKYKMLYYDSFVVFSPEIFVRIEDGTIRSFPMKGTIDASIPDAEKIILSDEKEEAEHNTIVDLIRNDISKVADNVEVSRYRYTEIIRSGNSDLLQVSSEIRGRLCDDYIDRLGDIIFSMLPAGSVSGAPKRETTRIIKESEICDRGWYTGIFGVFDGKSLDSGVMIRFIEQKDGQLIFRSGGGITSMSDPAREYEELISKIYVAAG